MRRLPLATLLLLLALTGTARAGGPRFVTGAPYFRTEGRPIGWQQPVLLYSTDPGDLSATVDHAAADALVAQAAAVWNVPVASITVAQGPALAEHVSSQNVYLGANGLQFPADVMSTNAAAVPLAVIYDSDGSVTDTLLGSGASLPGGCRQNAVTETVDSFDPAGYILHAIIIVNGRCTGTAAAAQQQLRYQLQRVFGRVLGLAWSQTNDNVFTGTPTPTPVQARNWPILHPIDIICGLYTYQCLPNPFTLRPDDIGALVSVYPIDGSNGIPSGKQLSYADAQGLYGFLTFPTGAPMAGVNVLVRREAYGTTIPDAFYIASGVSGQYAAHDRTSFFVAADTGPHGSQGSGDPSKQGFYNVPWIPMVPSGAGADHRLTSTEPVNPLYTGQYTLGPYTAGIATPSGTALHSTAYIVGRGVSSLDYTFPDAAATCSSGTDGTFFALAQVPASGWWQDRICGYRHISYLAATVKQNRSFTLEVTALDEAGRATLTKAMPVLGLYGPNDDLRGSLPSLGATATAFNSLALGTTALYAATGSITDLRIGLMDQRTEGRPDFRYQARLFYADDLAPAKVAATGGTITITGKGFRSGNGVLVNGVAAVVSSWSANSIVATVPSASAAGANGSALDVTVFDRTTGATSTLTAALTYSNSGATPRSMRLVSAPGGSQLVGDSTATPFQLQLVAANGTTPVAGVSVTLSLAYGSATFTACAGASPCTLLSDTNGLVTSGVVPTASGGVMLQAVAGSLSQQAAFTAVAQIGALLAVSTPETPLRTGYSSANAFAVQGVAANGTSQMPFRPVTFSVLAGAATFDACSAAPCTIFSDYTATARTNITPSATGPLTLQARDGDYTQTVTLDVLSGADLMRITDLPPAQLYLGDSVNFAVTLLRADGFTPDPGRPVTFTASPGATIVECGAATCTIQGNGGGVSFVNVNAAAPGTFTLTATYGSLVQTATFTVVAHAVHLKILSQPPDGSRTGVLTAAPFTVQVVNDDGTPASIQGRSMVLGGVMDTVVVPACGAGACEVSVDGNATATVQIIPQVPGRITLSAVFSQQVLTTTFIAAGGARSLRVVRQPVSGSAPVGVRQELDVQALDPNGQPLSGDRILFTVLSGSWSYDGGSGIYLLQTGGDGIAYTAGFPGAYGPVMLQADDGVVKLPISFIAGSAPNVLKLLGAPASPAITGQTAPVPFSVQVFAADGTTPAHDVALVFTLTSGRAAFSGCTTAACSVVTDSRGIASVSVTPLAAGTIGLLATIGAVSQPAGFTAVDGQDILQLVSAPSAATVGAVASVAFAVRALLPDGVTPAAGHNVSLAVTAGSATLAACAGASSCVLQASANGLVSTSLTPQLAGSITVQAADGAATQSATLIAAPPLDLLSLLSAPASPAGVGYPAPLPFSLRLVHPDGSPAAGSALALSVPSGSALFGACAAASCAVVTAADGTISTTVTPLAPGPITLRATEAGLTQSATFTAAALPGTLRVLSAPADGGYPGSIAAIPLRLQATLADGITPAVARPITLAVSAGSASYAACAGVSPCTLTTDTAGQVSSLVTPLSSGPITLVATDGTVSASATFNTLALPDTLVLASAPAGNLPTGIVAATLFRVRLFQADGSSDPGRTITFTATGASLPGCTTVCTVTTAADGSASVSVLPAIAGNVTLTATFGTLFQTASFTAFDRPGTLTLVAAPMGTQPTGVPASPAFRTLLLTADGLPRASQPIVFSGTNVNLAGCQALPCTLLTAADGSAAVSATPLADGPVTLTASYGNLVQSASFLAVTAPGTLTLLTSPSSTQPAGVVASTPFRAQLLLTSGLPAAGQPLTFSAVNASFPGCSALPCVLTTAADGTASVNVLPTYSGPVILSVRSGQLLQSVTFTAYPRPDTLSILATPGSTYVGAPAAQPFTVQLLAADGTPQAGVLITLASTAATFGACGASLCPLATDSNGQVSTIVTPTLASNVTITATAGVLTAAATFPALPNQYTVTSTQSDFFIAEGATAPISLALAALRNGSPASATALTWTGTPGLQPVHPPLFADASGQATAVALAGPLAAAAQARASVCAFPQTTCAAFTVTAVSPSAFFPGLVAGASQSLSAAAYTPVTLAITDAAGHPVAAAPVTIYQTVTALAAICPSQGRCPSAPILATRVDTVTADSAGRYTFLPLTIEGVASQTNMAIASGTLGFTTTILTRQP